jgi:hypothetical protein
METSVVITHYCVERNGKPHRKLRLFYTTGNYDTLRNVYMHDVIECICLFT